MGKRITDRPQPTVWTVAHNSGHISRSSDSDVGVTSVAPILVVLGGEDAMGWRCGWQKGVAWMAWRRLGRRIFHGYTWGCRGILRKCAVSHSSFAKKSMGLVVWMMCLPLSEKPRTPPQMVFSWWLRCFRLFLFTTFPGQYILCYCCICRWQRRRGWRGGHHISGRQRGFLWRIFLSP